MLDDPLPLRYVGATALQLGPLGLGVAPLGNLYAPVSDADAEATLTAAECDGVRWFDVAPLYGFGLAEERLGRFLRTHSGSAGRVISTKVGRVLEPVAIEPAHEHFVAPLRYRPAFDYSRSGIERSYEESLRRLGVDRVQVVLLHDIDRSHHSGHRAIVKQVLDEALPELHRLKADGRAKAIGLGICDWEIGYEILASADIDCVLLAGRYTLLDHTAFSSGFLDACARRRVSVLAGGVFNSGFLAGGPYYDYRPANEVMIRRRAKLLAVCDRAGVPLPAAALQFAAAHPAITSLVVGARSAAEVDAVVQWHGINIHADFWTALRKEELIPSESPTPRQLV